MISRLNLQCANHLAIHQDAKTNQSRAHRRFLDDHRVDFRATHRHLMSRRDSEWLNPSQHRNAINLEPRRCPGRTPTKYNLMLFERSNCEFANDILFRCPLLPPIQHLGKIACALFPNEPGVIRRLRPPRGGRGHQPRICHASVPALCGTNSAGPGGLLEQWVSERCSSANDDQGPTMGSPRAKASGCRRSVQANRQLVNEEHDGIEDAQWGVGRGSC